MNNLQRVAWNPEITQLRAYFALKVCLGVKSLYGAAEVMPPVNERGSRNAFAVLRANRLRRMQSAQRVW